MKIIIQGQKFIADFFSSVNSNVKYRKSIFCHFVSVQDGFLAFNTLSKYLLLLSKEDVSIINEEIMGCSKIAKYVSLGFMVPITIDEELLYKQIFSVAKMFANKTGISKYTIMPTLKCNANCFYCFENDVEKIDMPPEICDKVIGYIEGHSNNIPIWINWYGGEPLYNSAAIDYICDELTSRQMNFKSTMISNGYLFSNDLIRKAKSLWNLERVQITLDGTAKVYNRIKKYVYDDPNPFLTVISNIELLLQAGIQVIIRLNVGDHNVEDLFQLSAYLSDRFSKYLGFSVYIHRLFGQDKVFDPERELKVWTKLLELEEFLMKNHILKINRIKPKLKVIPCMAANDNSVMILPNGNLNKCELYSSDNSFGNVASEYVDVELRDSWKELHMLTATCKDCCLSTDCVISAKCDKAKSICSEYERKYKLKQLERSMILEYNCFLEKQGVQNKL